MTGSSPGREAHRHGSAVLSASETPNLHPGRWWPPSTHLFLTSCGSMSPDGFGMDCFVEPSRLGPGASLGPLADQVPVVPARRGASKGCPDGSALQPAGPAGASRALVPRPPLQPMGGRGELSSRGYTGSEASPRATG